MAIIKDHPRLNPEENRERRASIIRNGLKALTSSAVSVGGSYGLYETFNAFAGTMPPQDNVVTLVAAFSVSAITVALAGAKRYYSRTVDRIEGIGIPKSAAKTSPEHVARHARIHQAQSLIHQR